MEREKRYKLSIEASEWIDRRGTGCLMRPMNGKREEVQAFK